VSRAYNILLRYGFGVRFSDAQCGFKAARTDVVRPLMDKIEDDSWFFDTELLLLAEYNGLRVHEVPVDWIEDADSRVRIVRTAIDDLKGLARVAWTMAKGRGHVAVARPEPTPTHPDAVLAPAARLTSLAAIGMASLYALVYLPLREFWPAALTNLGALVLVGIVTRRRTLPYFRAVSCLLTTAAVLSVPPGAGREAEVGAVAATYVLLTLLHRATRMRSRFDGQL
jgi:hypothetical protein